MRPTWKTICEWLPSSAKNRVFFEKRLNLDDKSNVIDCKINKKCQFHINDLPVKDQNYQAVGWIAEHRKLMSYILQFISEIENINRIPTYIIPNTNNYDLIVAADGSNSNTKKKLKTPSFNFNYD